MIILIYCPSLEKDRSREMVEVENCVEGYHVVQDDLVLHFISK